MKVSTCPDCKFTADITYGVLASQSCLLTDIVEFEVLGIVRDDSESTSAKSVYKKGYHVTEACVLTSSDHPVMCFLELPCARGVFHQKFNRIH